MKLKDLLKHTQGFITVRIEETGKLIGEATSTILGQNLPAERLNQTVGLICDASDKAIKVSIIPRNR